MSVTLTDIHKTYADCVALDRVSLRVEEGEFMTLLGASGSGKTTLLNVVAGLIAPDAGSVVIRGQDMTWMVPRKRGLGMVFQSYALVPHLTVAENIAFPLHVRRMPGAEIRRRVNAILDVVQLAHLAGRKPRELSGGQQQRVAIARCLVYEPPVILMDEPLGALDKKLREQLQREIKRIHQETQVTILYVTHDQEEAMFLSDRICLMRAGRIAQIGAPRDLYFHPDSAFVADFLGESNLLECRLAADASVILENGQRVRIQPGCARTLACGEPMRLMIRPDRLRFVESARSDLNTLHGTVEDAAFVGETMRYGVRIGGDKVWIKVGQGARAEALESGQAVVVAWVPEDALVLAADEERLA